jgi:hypothetical protein
VFAKNWGKNGRDKLLEDEPVVAPSGVGVVAVDPAQDVLQELSSNPDTTMI